MKTNYSTATVGALAVGLIMALSGVGWAAPPFPVPPRGGLPECLTDLADCESDLGAAEGQVAVLEGEVSACESDLSGCQGQVVVLEADLATCDADLSACQEQVAGLEADLEACEAEPRAIFPGDGYIGAELTYTDNGDGTFTDNNTGLMWEIKTTEAGIHNVNNSYTWTDMADGDPTDPDGTAYTAFLADLNTLPGFAGFTEWRLPTAKELQSLVDYSRAHPSAVVHPDLPGRTAPYAYWSSTSSGTYGPDAWNVNFLFGYVGTNRKYSAMYVRAVRVGE